MSLNGLKSLLADIAPPPPPQPAAAVVATGNSDDDFQQPRSTQAPESEQRQLGDGGTAAPSTSAVAGGAAGKEGKPVVKYQHVPAAKRKEVYQHIHSLLGGKAINAFPVEAETWR